MPTAYVNLGLIGTHFNCNFCFIVAPLYSSVLFFLISESSSLLEDRTTVAKLTIKKPKHQLKEIFATNDCWTWTFNWRWFAECKYGFSRCVQHSNFEQTPKITIYLQKKIEQCLFSLLSGFFLFIRKQLVFILILLGLHLCACLQSRLSHW